MRIDFTGAPELSGYRAGAGAKAAVSAGAPSSAAAPEDRATLSAQTLSAPALVSQALATAGARAGKVEALRQAVAGGTYNPNPALTADAILSEEA